MFSTEISIHLLFRGALSASGQMIASVSSWNTLILSASPHPRSTIIFPFPLPPLGSISIILQNCYICLWWSRERNLDGGHVPVQFH